MNHAAPPTPDRASLLLSGLDGSNPLAFLAALGVLATLDRTGVRKPKMNWAIASGGWRPCLYAVVDSHDQLLDHLATELLTAQASTLQVWEANNKLPYPAQEFRALCNRLVAAADPSSRLAVDLAAALGVDTLTNKDGDFLDTALRMVRSGDSGGKGMPAYAKWIIENTTRDHLRQLISADTLLDEGTSLRWDPSELRTRALQWGDPSKEAVLSRRGLNRLALEALPIFTTAPVGMRVATVGFSRLPHEQGQAFTWPLWSDPLPLSVVRSLVALDALSADVPNAQSLAARGVAVAFRCFRFASSKYYSNFTPAMAV